MVLWSFASAASRWTLKACSQEAKGFQACLEIFVGPLRRQRSCLSFVEEDLQALYLSLGDLKLGIEVPHDIALLGVNARNQLVHLRLRVHRALVEVIPQLLDALEGVVDGDPLMLEGLCVLPDQVGDNGAQTLSGYLQPACQVLSELLPGNWSAHRGEGGRAGRNAKHCLLNDGRRLSFFNPRIVLRLRYHVR